MSTKFGLPQDKELAKPKDTTVISNIAKIEKGVPVYKREEFNVQFPADKYERYSLQSLNKFHQDLKKGAAKDPKTEADVLKKGLEAFNGLEHIQVSDKNIIADFYVRLKKSIPELGGNGGQDNDESKSSSPVQEDSMSINTDDDESVSLSIDNDDDASVSIDPDASVSGSAPDSSAGNGMQQNPNQQQEQGGGQTNDNQLVSHAKQTPSKDLEAFVNQEGADPKMVKIAQDELEARKNGQSKEPGAPGEPGEGGNGTQNPDDTDIHGNKEDDEEKQEFEKFIDSHFNDHDITDLQKYTIDLIGQSPKELKVLKAHYREEYQKKNGGNKVAGDIDAEDFEQYLKDYVAHKPFDHLKSYCISLLGQNPDAMKKIKGKFTSLKENNLLKND